MARPISIIRSRSRCGKKPVAGAGEENYYTQFTTNARQTVLLTSAKTCRKTHDYNSLLHDSFQYVGVVKDWLDHWKIKIRVVGTGRQFVADLGWGSVCGAETQD